MVIEVVYHMSLYFLTENALDAADSVLVFTGNEGKGIPGLFSASRPSDAVCIRVYRVRDIVVYNM